MAVLDVKNLKKIYRPRFGGNQVQALSCVNFSVEEGEYVAIMGESGSGKTTLLNIMAALDKPTEGTVLLDGKPLSSIKDKDIAQFRRDNLGFVFQEFNLLDTLTIRENISLALTINRVPAGKIMERVEDMADKLGIRDILDKFPYQVSGGQKQRCACARAMINRPRLILADEPTGALDSHSSQMLLDTIRNMNESLSATILMVTHSVRAASHAGRILFIKDGEVFHQLYRGRKTNDELYQNIADTLTMITTGGDRR